MEHPKLVEVKTCGSRLESDVAMSVLEDAGIQAMAQADTAGGMREHLAWTGDGFKIFVREEDAAAAREVLAPPPEGTLENEVGETLDPDDRPTWRRFT
jgi:hypothetical protein